VVLSRRVLALLVTLVMVLALGIIVGVLGAASLAPNNDDHRDYKGDTLTVVTKTPEIKVVDLEPQGPTQGDAIVQNAPLYNATGKDKIGRFDLFCSLTDPADESFENAHMAECTKTFTLPGGEISVQGREAYPDELSARPTPGEDAITGGTGKYAGVRGEQRFEPRRTKGINTFHFAN